MYHFTECGLDNVHLINGYEEKITPSGKAVSFKDLQNLLEVITQCVVNKAEPLNGREFRYLRIELDLSQKAIGNLMDKSEQTIANWEKGNESIPVLADKAIRDLYKESVGQTPTAGLLQKLSEVDRRYHEINIQIQLLEQEHRWYAEQKSA